MLDRGWAECVMSHMRHFLEPLLWTDVQWFRPTPLMFHTFVDICKFSSVSIFTRHMIVVFQWHHMRRCGLSLRPRNQCGWRGTGLVSWPVAASVAVDGGAYRRQAGASANGWVLESSMSDGERLRRSCWWCVCTNACHSQDQKSGGGEWRALQLVHGEAGGKTCGVQKDAVHGGGNGPQNIRRVVVEGSEHSGWFMEEQEDQLVEFRRML